MKRTVLVLLSALFLSLPVFAAPIVLDLRTPGSSGTLTAAIGGIFWAYQNRDQPAGSGTFDPFLRLHNTGNNPSEEQGFNTSIAKVLDDESPVGPGKFTTALATSAVGVTTFADGSRWVPFALDIDQQGAPGEPASWLSLDQVEIFQRNGDTTAYDLTAATSTTAPYISIAGLTPIFQMSSTALNAWNEILLNERSGPGFGSSDMVLYVPEALFDPALTNIIFYAHFGLPPGQYSNNDGPEQWSFKEASGGENCIGCEQQGEIPEPSTFVLLITGLALALAGGRSSFLRSRKK